MTPTPADDSRMLTALVQLRGALQDVRLPLEIDGAALRRTSRQALIDQLEDYVLPRQMSVEAPLLAVVGGSTGAGKSTLVNSIVGRRVTALRAAAPDHPVAGAGAPSRRRRVVRPGPAAARPGARRALHRRPRLAAAGRGRLDPAGARDPRRARRRLGRGAQPGPGRPGPRRGRPVALRHLGSALLRPGPVGAPQARGGPLHLGRGGARPHARRRRAHRRRAPRPDARQPRTQGLAAVHGGRRARSARRVCSRRARSPTSAAGSPRSPATPTPAPRSSSRPSTAPSAPSSRQSYAIADGAAAQLVALEALRASATSTYDEAGSLAVGHRRRRDACCAASCWPAGWSSPAPASCSRSVDSRAGRLRDRVVSAVKGSTTQQADRVSVAVEAAPRADGPRPRRDRGRAGPRCLGGRRGRSLRCSRRRPTTWAAPRATCAVGPSRRCATWQAEMEELVRDQTAGPRAARGSSRTASAGWRGAERGRPVRAGRRGRRGPGRCPARCPPGPVAARGGLRCGAGGVAGRRSRATSLEGRVGGRPDGRRAVPLARRARRPGPGACAGERLRTAARRVDDRRFEQAQTAGDGAR